MFIPQALPLEWTPAFLSAPVPQTPHDWMGRPEFQIPFAFGILILLVVIGLKLPGLASWWRGRHKDVLGPIELDQIMVGTPMVIIDLRPPEEFNGPKGHLKGSYNVPVQMLTRRLAELAKDKRNLVVLVDGTDKYSHLAAPILQASGYPWVRVLKGGIRAWQGENLPLTVSGRRA